MIVHYKAGGTRWTACRELVARSYKTNPVPSRVTCADCCWKVANLRLGAARRLINKYPQAETFVLIRSYLRRANLWVDRYKELKREPVGRPA